MVITPTITLTGSYVLWVDGSGNDVGSYAISAFQGIEVLVFLLAIVLGQVLAIKIWP